MEPSFLQTDRIAFGHWQSDDLERAQSLWGDPEVTRLIGGPFSADAIEARLEREIHHQNELGFQYWPLYLKPTGEFVGCCGFRPSPSQGRTAELGFHLRRAFWGKGLATEAALGAIGYGFDVLGLGAIVAGHNPMNDASRRTLLKLGFRYLRDEYYAPTGLDHPTYELQRGSRPGL